MTRVAHRVELVATDIVPISRIAHPARTRQHIIQTNRRGKNKNKNKKNENNANTEKAKQSKEATKRRTYSPCIHPSPVS